jgi:HEAT repeats
LIQTPTDALTVLRDFEENPVRAGRELRSALRTDGGAFLSALLNETVFAGNDRGFRFAIDLLVSSDMVIPAIATPSSTSFVQALRLTRYMLEADGNFLNALLTALMTRQDLADPACTVRVLDLISECATHLANWRSLIRIHSDGDAEIKARCAALLARYRFRDEDGLERFRRSDPRIRANIIQTLWGVSQDQANAILQVAVQDEDNRVAGNACLALYNSGDTRALLHLAEMLSSPDPKKKVTAAWVIGQCRDGRFASRLLEALRGDLPALRKRSITSLAKLEAIPSAGAASAPNSSSDLDLCFVSAPANPTDAGFDLWLHVAGPGGEQVPHLRPVDFFVWSGAQPPRPGEEFLFDYTVEESAYTSAAVRIVYPAGSKQFERALAASLEQKPAEQCWALSSYGKAAAPSTPAPETRFETDKTALTNLLETGPVLSSGPMEAVTKILAPESALDEQHLVLLLDGSSLELEPVRALCEAQKNRLHCWHLTQNTTQNAGPAGVFRTEEQSAAIWPRFVASIAARYTLHTSVIPAAVALRNAAMKPARFSARAELLKVGPNA